MNNSAEMNLRLLELQQSVVHANSTLCLIGMTLTVSSIVFALYSTGVLLLLSRIARALENKR